MLESKIIPAEKLVLTRSWGIVTCEEVAAHHKELLTDPEFNPDYDQLGIHVEADAFQGTAEQWAAIGREKLFSQMSFRAHVAVKDSVYGILRLAATHHELEHKHESAETFRDEMSARKWLSEMRAKREAMTFPVAYVESRIEGRAS